MVYFSGAKSGDEFLDDLSAKLAQLLVAATMEISQLVVVQAEQMKQGDVQVADRVDYLGGFRADFVGGPYDGAPIVTKAGGFGSEDALMVGLRTLKGEAIG